MNTRTMIHQARNQAAVVFRLYGGRNYIPSAIDFEDLVQVALVAILKGLDDYDPSLGCESTYYRSCAKNGLLAYVRSPSSGYFRTYVGWRIANLTGQYRAALKDNGSITVESFGKQKKKQQATIRKICAALLVLRPAVSVHPEFDITKRVNDEPAIAVELLRQLLPCLSELEQDVISRYYGLDCEPQNLEQIAEALDVTKQWVSHVKNRALDAMKYRAEYILGVKNEYYCN